MLGMFFFLAILITLSLSIKIVFRYSVEVSLFLTFCIISILLAIAGLLGILEIGLYAIYVIIIISFIVVVIYIFRNKSIVKPLFIETFTPAMVLFIFTYITYYVVIQDKVLIHDDEAGSWASQVKYMYETFIYKDFTSHGHIFGFFTFFNLKIMGYKESIYFLSLWAFKWSALILAMKEIKWDKWYIVLIFGIAGYGIINIIYEHEPAYYMDVMLGVLSGALCAGWSISRKTNKDYVWLFIGLIVLGNLKDELSATMAVLVAIFSILSSSISKKSELNTETNDKKPLRVLDLCTFCLAFYFVYTSGFWKLLVKLIAKLGYIAFFIALAITVICLVICYAYRNKIIRFIKKHKALIIATILSAIFIIALILLYSIYPMIPKEMVNRIKVITDRLWYDTYFGKPTYMLVLLSIVYVAINSIFLIKKRFLKGFLLESSYIVLAIPCYGLILMFGYLISVGNSFDHWMHSFSRYFFPIILLASIWLLAKTLRMEKEYKIPNTSIITGLILLCLLGARIPALGTKLFSNYEHKRSVFTYELRPDIREQADFIKGNVENGKVLVATSTEGKPWDPFTAALWLEHELIPIETSMVILLNEEDVLTYVEKKYSSKQLQEYLKDNDFRYVYFYSKSDYIDEKYSDILEYCESEQGVLYEVTPEAEHYLSIVKIK